MQTDVTKRIKMAIQAKGSWNVLALEFLAARYNQQKFS